VRATSPYDDAGRTRTSTRLKMSVVLPLDASAMVVTPSRRVLPESLVCRRARTPSALLVVR
ncbi:MAG TPA: hypothetical protein VKV16_00175, partial [Solirubrobacteraceae bacterium]|nr:hypothetical protein [Solirubrobacteraceae bacterium]